MKTTLRSIACVVVLLLMCDVAGALPRFAARTGAKCQSCHVNPSGGGIRQAFGVQYGREELPVPTWSEEYNLDEFSTQITEFMSVGADFRTLFFYQQSPDTGATGSTSHNAFWQMQGDVYLNFRIAKKVNIYLDKGIHSGYEIFGLLNILPANGFIKVGKFSPNFGMKTDDHTAYVREHTGFSAERGRPEITGAEIGVSPGPVTISGGIYNAADVPGAGAGKQKAFLGRAEGMFKATEEINIGVGANVFTRRNAAGLRTTLLGGFGAFSYQDFTLLAEVDMIKNKFLGSTTDGMAAYIEANYVVTPGLDLKAAYDFYDPDIDIKTGSLGRYSFGFEFFPISGVELRPMYRIVREDPKDFSNDEFHMLIHFYL